MALIAVVAGCADHCAEIAAARQALLAPVAVAPGPQIEVTLSVARANAFIAELLRDQPVTVEVQRHAHLPLGLALPDVRAHVRELRVLAAAPGRVHVAVRVELADDVTPITTLAFDAELVPVLERAADGRADLVATFAAVHLAGAPDVSAEARAALLAAAERWLPGKPSAVRDELAQLVVAHVADFEARVVRELAERAPLRVHLPDLPVTGFDLTTTDDRLTLALTTGLPVAQALAPAPPDAASEAGVRISTSAAVALANWSIDHGRAPAHYARDLQPRADGEFRPYFAYVASDARRPLKIHVFQERGGCSYFEVGLQLQLAVVGSELVASALDRYVETVIASSPIEAAVWLEQLVRGAVDSSKHAVAEIGLTIGPRHFTTRVVGASAAHDQLAFELRIII